MFIDVGIKLSSNTDDFNRYLDCLLGLKKPSFWEQYTGITINDVHLFIKSLLSYIVGKNK